MPFTKTHIFGTLILLLFLAPLSVTEVSSHSVSEPEYGGYRLDVGFLEEPTYAGLENAVQVKLIPVDQQASDNSPTVDLRVVVRHLVSEPSTTFELKLSAEALEYHAKFIPTVPGGYEFRIVGVINDDLVDYTVSSSSTTFDTVISLDEINVPRGVSSNREISNLITSLESEIDSLNRLSTGLIIGILIIGAFMIGFTGLIYFFYSKPAKGRRKP